MNISQLLLPELDQEASATRRTIERVPEDKLDYRPHSKSMTMGRLAGHVADLLYWGAATLLHDSFDVAPPDGPAYEALVMTSRAQVLEAFDQNLKETREALADASDAHLARTWKLLSGGKELFAMPRQAALRSFVFNHIVHHRGQLSVYLRMNDVPVPALYGPSADEKSF